VPPLVTDIDLSLDDRFLYVSCWGTGELRQYDVSDPMKPKLSGSVHIGGVTRKTPHPGGGDYRGGPQMVEISRDGKRVYGLAAVATGLASLCGEVRCLVAGLGGASLSDALRRLPAHLRQACAEERTHCRAIGAAYEVDLVCGLIGLCDGEMRGVVFAEAAGF
jgi:hypothetical protein